MKTTRLSRLINVFTASLIVGSAAGCYNFKAARQDIADKEAELRRLQNEISDESTRRKALENDPHAK